MGGLVTLIGLVCMTSLLGLRGFNQSSMRCPPNYPDMLPDVDMHELSCCDLDHAAPLTLRSTHFAALLLFALGVTLDIFRKRHTSHFTACVL